MKFQVTQNSESGVWYLHALHSYGNETHVLLMACGSKEDMCRTLGVLRAEVNDTHQELHRVRPT